MGHRKCQLISVYTSKDLPILHFVYHYVGYFSFHFFALISFVWFIIHCKKALLALIFFPDQNITHDIFTIIMHYHRKFLIPNLRWQEVNKMVTPCWNSSIIDSPWWNSEILLLCVVCPTYYIPCPVMPEMPGSKYYEPCHASYWIPPLSISTQIS